MAQHNRQRKTAITHSPDSPEAARVGQQNFWQKASMLRKTLVILCGVLVLLALGVFALSDRIGLNLPWLVNHSVSDVSHRVLPSVVTITSTDSDEPDSTLSEAQGSGVVIDPRGLIITNYHVIEQGTRFEVQFESGTKYRAEVVGFDPLFDIAVLRIVAPRLLPYARLGDSAGMRVGDWVVTVGNPMGVGLTVTSGIVSAQDRRLSKQQNLDYVQIDAAINQGNSGGPLFDLRGRVVGINTSIIANEAGGWRGIGFAITSNSFKPVVEQIIHSGRVHRGWQGVRLQEVERSLLDLPDGVAKKSERLMVVAGIVPKSPAAESEIQLGDIVLKIDGQAVNSVYEAQNLILSSKINRKLRWELLRKGRKISLGIKVAELPESDLKQQRDDLR
ncbi:MAG: trypsin-like peptidase domain-containing protein, partial [Alphaproteobacteria bacterium]|nr:trypsin-like peptidase domain-containing protein [Alphaproteobacteria bacterium]